jgi:FkbM family methyltransferase
MNILNKLFKLTLIVKTIENFPTAILDRVGLLHGKIIYKIRRRNMRFIARAKTEDLAEIVVVTSGYEYNTKLIHLPKKPEIIDLGGHIGSFSISMADMFKDKCKIYAFEPDKENFAMLLENVALNKLHSIKAKNIAISNFVGKGYLKNEKMNTDAYYLDSSNNENSNCLISTLSTAMQPYKIKRIDLLKIDVEGAEYKIFLHKPSLSYIQKNVHYIFMEYHDIDNHYNYSLIKKVIESNFLILNKRTNILALENLKWKYD